MPYTPVTTNQAITTSFLNTNYGDQVVSTVLAAGKPAGTEGQLIAVTNQDRLEVYDGAAWVRVGNWAAAGRTGASVTRVATQSIGTASETAVSFDTEGTDTDGFIAVTATTLTIPSGLGGIYAVTGMVTWASSPGANSAIRLEMAGSGSFNSVRSHCGTGTWAFSQQGVSSTQPLAAASTIILYAYQATGSSINITARLDAWRISA